MADLAAVRDVVVFRALMLGDLLCATPALRALRAALPAGARLALCGLPWAAELARRLPGVDEFIPFPGHPALPERQPGAGEFEAFVDAMRARRFDLALQMHGSGQVVNRIVAAFGARSSAGFATAGAPPLALSVPWPTSGTEIERCLALTDALGAPRRGLQLDLPVREDDRAAARALLAAAGVHGRYAIVHPGAQLPSRRWPVERFAAVADALAARGLAVVVTGSAGEAALARALCAQAARPPIDLAGRTELGTLAALVADAALLVCNDTGLSHVAAAVGTPSVVVASGSEVARWAPLDRQRHRVLWADLPCRPCAHATCPTAHECAAAILPAAVVAAALDLLQTRSEPECPIADYASSPGTSTATTCTT
jgi:ADP-heptose:LPS heptosyltransferase